MHRARVIAAALFALALIPATATAADPPPGAKMSDNLQYVKWIPDTRLVVEGKFDKVGGKDILVLTGRFGFKTIDVTDPENPKPLDSYLPPEINQNNGDWQDEDMELDTKRNLIIGALDPRHNDADPAATGCPDPDNLAVRDPDCMSGFYVISYDNRRTSGRSATSSTCPPATRRAASRAASTAGRGVPRGAAIRTTSEPSSRRTRCSRRA